MRKNSLLLLVIVSALSLIFLTNVYAHYVKGDIKAEVKKIGKGIQITLTSDDPEVARQIQENSRYYEDIVAGSDYWPHMERMAYHRHGCM
jgi:hypothetical protein